MQKLCTMRHENGLSLYTGRINDVQEGVFRRRQMLPSLFTISRSGHGAIEAGLKIHFFQTEGLKKLAEAGPPGKLPHGSEGGGLSLKCFIFKVANEKNLCFAYERFF
jgi:hypothetical protein